MLFCVTSNVTDYFNYTNTRDKDMSDKPVNPDLVALHSVIEDGLTNVSLDVNPLAVHLNTRIQSASKGKVSMSFDLADQYIQGNGVVQGGALAMMLDFGLAFGGLSQVTWQQNLSTTNMNISLSLIHI